MNTQSLAIAYIRRGWCPIPLPFRQKYTKEEGWPELRFTEETAPSRFNGKPQNVGVILGDASGGLVDVDLDHPRAVELADSFLPHTDAVFGRPGKLRSHRLYRCPGLATKRFQLKTRVMVVELRGNAEGGKEGLQTVFPPSVHPSGEPISWDGCDWMDKGIPVPAEVTAGEITDAVQRLFDAVRKEMGEAIIDEPVVQTVRTHQRPAGPSRMSAQDRCHLYLSKMPNAVSGQGGHNATLAAACTCFKFGLSAAEAAAEMAWFNLAKCTPAWNERELNHKIADAYKLVSGEGKLGEMLKNDRPEPLAAKRAVSQPETPEAPIPPQADDDPPMDDASLDDIAASCGAGGGGDDGGPPTDIPALPDPIMDRPTELSAAETILRRHGENIRYDVEAGHWLVWTGSTWQQNDEQVESWAIAVAKDTERRLGAWGKQAATFAKRAESASGASGILKLTSWSQGVPVHHAALNADQWLLPCLNTTIDLKTGTSRDPRPADLFSMQAPVTYDPAATCPLWESFLGRIFDANEALIQYMQRWCGLALTGDSSNHELGIWYGAGANGKSSMIDTIAGIMGPFAITAPESLLVVRSHNEHATEVAVLAGRRLAIASETESGGRMRVQLMKRLTGDATLTARFMRQDFFEFPRTHKLVLVTNNRPAVDEDSEAVWRRIRLVPFSVTIPERERDPQMPIKLAAERSGILNWMLAGLRQYLEAGLCPPPDVLAATEEYRADSADHFEDFRAECLMIGEGLTAGRRDLADTYDQWCERHHVKRKLDQGAFLERIRRLPAVREGGQARRNGRKDRIFDGIGIAFGVTGTAGTAGTGFPVDAM